MNKVPYLSKCQHVTILLFCQLCRHTTKIPKSRVHTGQ